MQTLTKTEIAWMYGALEHEAQRLAQIKRDAAATEDGFTAYVAELRSDGLRAVMHKLHTALNDDDKRIAIK